MRKMQQVTLIGALTLLLMGCQSLSWQEFLAPDARFQILMPGLPELQIREVQTGFGALEQTLYEVDRGPQAFMAGFTQLTDEVLAGYTVDEILEDAAGRGVAGVRGEVLDFQTLEVGGYPARELQIVVAEGDGLIHARFILADDRLYQISAIVATSLVDNEVNLRFLDSFEVLD